MDSTQTNKTEEPKKENSSQPLLENIPERKTAKQETEEEVNDIHGFRCAEKCVESGAC